MKRVFHVIGSLDRGGAESVLLDLVRADTETEHHILCWSGREGLLADAFRSSGAKVHVAKGSNQWKRLRNARRRFREVGSTAVVSHVSLASAFILAAVSPRTRPRVARLHSAGDGRHASVTRRVYRAIARMLLPWTSTHVLAVSSASLDFAVGRWRPVYGILGTVAQRLPNGVDTDRFVPRETQGDSLSPPLVLHIGRAAPEKNRAVLVPIFTALRRRGRVRMDVVGTTSTADMGPLPGSSDFAVRGQRFDIERAIASADVLVLPSFREGLPGVILEALSCAVPVVVSDLSTLRELEDDLDGLSYVDVAASPEAWADAIEHALAMSWEQRLRLRAKLLASPYTLERNVEQWVKLWH